jgi:hypothetical protein
LFFVCTLSEEGEDKEENGDDGDDGDNANINPRLLASAHPDVTGQE